MVVDFVHIIILFAFYVLRGYDVPASKKGGEY